MSEKNEIFTEMTQAIAADYVRIYLVNYVTGEFHQFVKDKQDNVFREIKHGNDFFNYLTNDAVGCVYEADRYIYTEIMQRENIIRLIKPGSGCTDIECRLVSTGEPRYYTLRIMSCPGAENCFVLGIVNSEKTVSDRNKTSRINAERDVYDQIAESLAVHFEEIYYIDIANGHFKLYSPTGSGLGVKLSGDDFYEYSHKKSVTHVHPDDRKAIMHIYTKSGMIEALRGYKCFTTEFRYISGDETQYYKHTGMWANDRKHIIIYAENITNDIKVEKELHISRKRNRIFGLILESLAARYDVIYYVNAENGNYTGFASNNIYGNIEIEEEGTDFFADARKNTDIIIHPDDRERVKAGLDKDYYISALENNRQLVVNYRHLIDGVVKYTRYTAVWGSDGRHFIIGVENTDEEVKKESEHLRELSLANEMARRDELTGTKNKNAYQEYENLIQNRINAGEEMHFAIAVCDINDLKIVNDELGHKAGDEYIRTASRMICEVFVHSPVFRIGGDEFTVFVSGADYADKELLVDRLRRRIREKAEKNSRSPVIACGMAVYDSLTDKNVSDVFNRADSIMYENKVRLKEAKGRESENETGLRIPEERRKKLDSLFEAFSIVAEGNYVYLCDMKYDCSRWSKNAVETFGLPGEYMIGAGDIWEDHIHPDDRPSYHASIGMILSGNAFGHDMQYRARRRDGRYDVCTCKGTVIKTGSGEPDYFGGVIRNHSMIGHIDALTGLGNQYELFDAIRLALSKKTSIRVCMIGISKFSEINEIYGYSFGNTVLQKFGRIIFDDVSIRGSVFRLDGTKFAVITTNMDIDEIKTSYEKLRSFCRTGFVIDDRQMILELNAGLISIDDFSVDERTVYACLNFTYSESKTNRQGELVEFINDLNDRNRLRIEKLHAIRASITHGYEGFFLLYQPVVDADTEELIGAEALLRWKNDEYGVVPPDLFIPILEKDPLFCDLGLWILRTALIGAKKLIERYPEFVINVNLSYIQLERHDFVDTVISTLDEVGFPASRLCLEITERCRLLDMELLKNVIINLRGKGIKVALDDFGTGFSSLAAAKNLPFDTIKIDRSFVMKIEEDEKDREIIGNFADLARTFGSKICVEGIETEGMCEILRKYRVQSFQGYYYGKPIRLEELLEWKKK